MEAGCFRHYFLSQFGRFSKALNNLIVLARENDGANEIIASNGLSVLSKLVDASQTEIKLAITRILASLSKNSLKRVSFFFFQLILFFSLNYLFYTIGRIIVQFTISMNS